MIVCFEGIDRCGKSSHAEKLTKRLSAEFYKFPNKNTPTGKLIYEHLSNLWCAEYDMDRHQLGDSIFADALVFQALQIMNRLESAHAIATSGNRNIVFDRYWPSGYAYGTADGLDPAYLIDVHKTLPQPDLFLLLDIDVDEAATRRPGFKDRYEEDAEFLKRVAANYRTLWSMGSSKMHFPGEWVVINARGTPEQTEALINEAVADWRSKAFERGNIDRG